MHQFPRVVRVLGRVEDRPSREADCRESFASRSDRHRDHGKVVGRHAFGDCDQRVRVLIEEGAGARVEARDDLVEAPVDRVLGRIALLVKVHQELDACDRARLVEPALSVGGEELVGAVHHGRHHDPAVGAARAAAQAVAVLSVQLGYCRRRRHELVHSLRRFLDPGLFQQLLVVEHRPQVEAVGDHGHLAIGKLGHVDGLLRQRRAVIPFRHIIVERHELVGIKRLPGVRHLDHVGNVAARDHGRDGLEGLTPGNRDDLDIDAGVLRLEPVDHAFQHFGAFRAGDHLDKLQRFRLRRRTKH